MWYYFDPYFDWFHFDSIFFCHQHCVEWTMRSHGNPKNFVLNKRVMHPVKEQIKAVLQMIFAITVAPLATCENRPRCQF